MPLQTRRQRLVSKFKQELRSSEKSEGSLVLGNVSVNGNGGNKKKGVKGKGGQQPGNQPLNFYDSFVFHQAGDASVASLSPYDNGFSKFNDSYSQYAFSQFDGLALDDDDTVLNQQRAAGAPDADDDVNDGATVADETVYTAMPPDGLKAEDELELVQEPMQYRPGNETAGEEESICLTVGTVGTVPKDIEFQIQMSEPSPEPEELTAAGPAPEQLHTIIHELRHSVKLLQESGPSQQNAVQELKRSLHLLEKELEARGGTESTCCTSTALTNFTPTSNHSAVSIHPPTFTPTRASTTSSSPAKPLQKNKKKKSILKRIFSPVKKAFKPRKPENMDGSGYTQTSAAF